MKVLVLPRDPTPYQGLLYGEMQRLGVQVRYLGGLTPSHTLNLLLLPLETAAGRIGGARLIHLHWVFGFTLPGARRFPLLRRMAQLWFATWLWVCRVMGMRLVWTAHNVLPHEPVFADDIAARRALVRSCDLVLAHSPSALAALAGLGAVAPQKRRHPARPDLLRPGGEHSRRWPPGATDSTRRFLFFGQVQEYKGVEELLKAFLAAARGTRRRADRGRPVPASGYYGHALQALAQRGGARITLRLEYIPDDEVARCSTARTWSSCPSGR